MPQRNFSALANLERRIEPADITSEQTGIPLESTAPPSPPPEIPAGELPADRDGGLVIQSVDRALTILEVLAASAEPMRLQEIAAATELKAPTCYHLLNSLVVRGYAARNAHPRSYSLGPKLVEISRSGSSSHDITRSARPHLEALRSKTGSTTCLAALQGTYLVLRDEIEGSADLSLTLYRQQLGRAVHATALGKAILAWLPESQIARVVADNYLTRFTARSIDNLAELVESLRQIRRHGFSIEDRELQDDVVGVACALRDRSGGVVGSIGCLVPATKASSEVLGALRVDVADCAKTISQLIR